MHLHTHTHLQYDKLELALYYYYSGRHKYNYSKYRIIKTYEMKGMHKKHNICVFVLYLRTKMLLINVAGKQKMITRMSASARLTMKKLVTVRIRGALKDNKKV